MMPRQVNKSWICIAFALSILLILFGSRYNITDNIGYHVSIQITRSLWHNVTTEDRVEWSLPLTTNLYDGSPNIEHILDSTRSKIKFELRNYNFTYSGVNKLDDLLMESGGRPVRSIIISTWRSGSNFLGDLLNAMPGTFYNFEPLFRFRSNQVRQPPHTDKAISELKRMLKCDFSGMEDYFDFAKTNNMSQFKYNTRLWNHCRNNKKLCSDADFTAKFCKLFPFQNMKFVRLRLRLLKDTLQDDKLNAKIVLLIRDPRGVMLSRQGVEFCQLGADCWEPELLCADMISDYIAAGRLFQKHPESLRVLRFEDLALNINKTTAKLLKFLRLSAMPSVYEFLQSHTNHAITGSPYPYSTKRVSRDIPFKWKSALNFDYVNELQGVCSDAMELWGYKQAHNASHMASQDFYPLEPYTLMKMTHL